MTVGQPTTSDAGTDLLSRASELIAIPSLSHQEQAIADHVHDVLVKECPFGVTRIGNNVVARSDLGRSQRLIIAGHLDTVAPNANSTPRRDGDVLWGLGAADMKGTLAVMLHLATGLRDPAVDVTWCFYATEEVEQRHNGLLAVWRERPELLAADAAVLGEPTDGFVEAGCQGTMMIKVTLGGIRAHTARPFTGRNAIHRMAHVLERVATWPVRRVTLDGCEYAEQLQAVSVQGGIARNVVPDMATVVVNYRFAPDRDSATAREIVTEIIGDAVESEAGDQLEVVDAAEGAPPALGQPLLQQLVQRSGQPPRAKVGWTDVASFWSHGVPAANFGAGDPLLAHHPEERVTKQSLLRVHDTLHELLSG